MNHIGYNIKEKKGKVSWKGKEEQEEEKKSEKTPFEGSSRSISTSSLPRPAVRGPPGVRPRVHLLEVEVTAQGQLLTRWGSRHTCPKPSPTNLVAVTGPGIS